MRCEMANYFYDLPAELQDKIYMMNVMENKKEVNAEILGVLEDFVSYDGPVWEEAEYEWELDGLEEELHPEVCAEMMKEYGKKYDYSKYAVLILYHYDIWARSKRRTMYFRQRGINGKGWVYKDDGLYDEDGEVEVL